MKQIFEKIAAKSDFSFEALEVDRDHLHCLGIRQPRLSPVVIVRETRTISTLAEARKRTTETILEGANILE